MRKFLSLLLCLILFAVPLTGCKEAETEDGGFTVVASIYPLYIALLNLTDGVPGVSAELMTAPDTGCLHDYTLLPGDMKKLETCELFVINGAGMESFLDRVLENRPELTILDASEGIVLLPAEEEHDHEEDDEHDHEGHMHENNAHVWTSVEKHCEQIQNITEGLCLQNPENEALYRENAEGYLAKLEELKGRMTQQLEDIKGRSIVTFHEAFSYFAEEFGLNIEAVIAEEPEEAPSPQRIRELVELVRVHDIQALFVEPQYNSASAKVVAAETGCELLILDPIVTGERDKAAYLTGMEQNAAVLRRALMKE